MIRDAEHMSLEAGLSAACETRALEGGEADRWAVHGVRPRLLCAPSTAEALGRALALCDGAGATAIPWGGGTQQRLGLPPRQADVVIATGGLNRLVEYEPADLTATVEAGMAFADFQAVLAGSGQWLPLDPPLMPGATVGGLVATNASGSRRLKDGGLRDLVIGTRVANVDGTLTRAGGRVVKNVTGYDLNKAHIGALGTLGILVEVAFKVAPRPETERSWFGTFSTAEAAGETIARLSRLPLTPTALDLLNDRAARRIGLPVSFGQWALLGRAGGFRRAVERHLGEFEATARHAGALDGQPLPEGAAEALWRAYGEMAAELRWSPGAMTCRLALPPAATAPLGHRIAETGPEPVVWAHGTGALFWSISVGAMAASPAAIASLREQAGAAGGGLVVENWPQEMAGLDVWGAPAGPMALMRAMKEQFDPRGTINPGRYVGGI